jgi:hypothetical protein
MNRSEVSQLLGGKVSRFTLDRLIKAHNHLDKGTRISLVFGTRKAQPTTARESPKPATKRATSPSLAGPYKMGAAKIANAKGKSDKPPENAAPKHAK